MMSCCRSKAVRKRMSFRYNASPQHQQQQQQWFSEPQYRLFWKAKNLKLSESELRLLHSEWEKLVAETDDQIGLVLMRWVFKKDARIKTLFGLAHVHDEAVMETCPRLVKHCLVLQDTLSMIIDALSTSNETLGASLVTFGSQHAFLTRRGFDPTYWNAFGDALMEIIQQGQGRVRLKQLTKVWSKLVRFILSSMQVGYAIGWQSSGIELMAQHTLQTAVIDSDLLFVVQRSSQSSTAVDSCGDENCRKSSSRSRRQKLRSFFSSTSASPSVAEIEEEQFEESVTPAVPEKENRSSNSVSVSFRLSVPVPIITKSSSTSGHKSSCSDDECSVFLSA